MWSDIIFPYAHESDCLNLHFQNFKLDNEPTPSAEVTDKEQKTISLFTERSGVAHFAKYQFNIRRQNS